jgi:hypothetical protein
MITDLVSEDEYWTDIFDGITSEVIPLKYVDSVLIVFKNNKIVDIPVDDLEKNWDKYHAIIMEYISNNSKKIKTVSYNVNLLNIRTDISKKTSRLLKKYKL